MSDDDREDLRRRVRAAIDMADLSLRAAGRLVGATADTDAATLTGHLGTLLDGLLLIQERHRLGGEE